MLGLLLPLLVPVDRLDTVSLGIVSKDYLQHVTIGHAHLLRDCVHDAFCRHGKTRRHPLGFLLFSHADNMRHGCKLLQYMYVELALWLHNVRQIRYNTGNYNSCMNLVTGVYAIVGLSSNGQQPTPGESLSPLFGGFVLRCF